MPKRRMPVFVRRPHGDVDFFEMGRLARAEGRPIWANPGVGQEAAEWRTGYLEATAPLSQPVPEFA